MQRKRNTSPLLVGWPLWKSVWWFLRKLDIVLPEHPIIPLLGIYPREAPTYNKNICTTMFLAALFIIARSWKEPRCFSVDVWIQKLWYIYTMEYYSAIRNNDFMKFLRKFLKKENEKPLCLIFTHQENFDYFHVTFCFTCTLCSW